MRTVALLVPWRASTDPARQTARDFVVKHYAPMGITPTFGDAPTRRFSRTASRNAAAAAAGAWDVAVMLDADCIVPLDVLEYAIRHAAQTGKMILPHNNFVPLSQSGTQKALTAPDVSTWSPLWSEPPIQNRMKPSGVLVFPRTVWDAVGGYDERLSGWGFEDTAMLWALDAVADGWARTAGTMWHLWHQPASATWLSTDKALFERYKAARGDRMRMTDLLGERTRLRSANHTLVNHVPASARLSP